MPIIPMLPEEPENNQENNKQQSPQTAKKPNIFQRAIGATTGGVKNAFSSIGRAVSGAGNRIIAGGMALVQSASVTGIVATSAAGFGLGSLGLAGIASSSSDVSYGVKDDSIDNSNLQCVDEYFDTYKAVFGSLQTDPLAEKNYKVVNALRDINEWSKEFVGQDTKAELVCMDPTCSYYLKTACPYHSNIEKGSKPDNLSAGGRIDLANVRRIYDFLSAYGLTDVQIAAICGVATLETRIDFTSVEGYNIQGDRYNLNPAATTDEYAWKAWAEGITDGSPITTPTCIHQLAANVYTGSDNAIDYAAYSEEYPAIYKLGIGLYGFTDGPGLYNNTFLRNYADYLNNKVTAIQNYVEGARGWQEDLRKRAADMYDIAYGADDNDRNGVKRGRGDLYTVKVAQALLHPESQPKGEESTGETYKEWWYAYGSIKDELKEAVEAYNKAVAAYEAVAPVEDGTYHTVTATPVTDDKGGTVGYYDIVFDNYEYEDFAKCMTGIGETSKHTEIPKPEQIRAGGGGALDGYIQYEDNATGVDHNHTNVSYYIPMPTWTAVSKGTLNTFAVTSCSCPAKPTPPEKERTTYCGKKHKDANGKEISCPGHKEKYKDYNDPTYLANLAKYNAAKAEHDAKYDACEKANAAAAAVKSCYETMMNIKKRKDNKANTDTSVDPAYGGSGFDADLHTDTIGYDQVCAMLKQRVKDHAHSVVDFYNALADAYSAAELNLENMLQTGALDGENIFYGDWYTEPTFTYDFFNSADRVSGNTTGEGLKFMDLLKNADSDEDMTPQQLKACYELWQNYAKYATDLPKNGQYINWWTPEVQLLFMVGGSYNAEKGRGIKIADKYRNVDCPICQATGVPEYDTTGEYNYNFMSTWKGDDYTGRNIAAATETFFYKMASGGFDDGTLDERTNYAFAYYYMFQYGSPYQQTISFAGSQNEASRILDEMIAEGRWQTNGSNTLSDTAMPHNDRWKEYQTRSTWRQWEMDTSSSMSQTMLNILGVNQNKSKVNLLGSVWNGCKYTNFVNNSTIGYSTMYLVDDPLIYLSDEEKKNNQFYMMKYGGSDVEPVNDLYKTVHDVISKRLQDNGYSALGSIKNDTSGFTFVKTAILWSGLDKEFEKLDNLNDLKAYLNEATFSLHNESAGNYGKSESAQQDGRGNTMIWEQRRLGPYYDGGPQYRYQWVLVPRVLNNKTNNSNSNHEGGYDDIRDIEGEENGRGNTKEDYDDYINHQVEEHQTTNMPNSNEGYNVNGYNRPTSDNNQIADWVRVDWECWDKDCTICNGKGGHGDFSSLMQGDLIIKDDKVYVWLGEQTVQKMYPLDAQSDEENRLVMAGGDDPTKLKSAADAGFEWSAPCSSYHNHTTGCTNPNHITTASPSAPDASSCLPYNPDGKWTVYRLTLSNYTDTYRNAGVVLNMADEDEYNIWKKFNWRGYENEVVVKPYLNRVRDELGVD